MHAFQPVGAMFSQECAKASFPDICSIPIQANKARQIIGVSFDLNDTVVKIGRAFNTRRNTRLRDKVARRSIIQTRVTWYTYKVLKPERLDDLKILHQTNI
jgi:hypothetical protein